MTASATLDRVIATLVELGDEIDRSIADGATTLTHRRRQDWTSFEVVQGLDDLYGLSRGADCAYDRPSIGASYGLWYHGQRMQQVLQELLPYLNTSSPPARIIDIGCGTGATAWAVALASAAIGACGGSLSNGVSVEGVDSSPFMTEAALRLWAALQRGLKRAGLGPVDVRPVFKTRSWTDGGFGGDGALVVASYLFDQSDVRHVDEVVEHFIRLGDAHDVSGAVLTTSPRKAPTLARVVSVLCDNGWEPRAAPSEPVIWKGVLPECQRARTEWYSANGSPERSAPSWIGGASEVRHLARLGSASGRLFAVGHSLPDTDQEEAATPDGRMTVVVGAAGSGKSRVIAERVVHVLEGATTGRGPRILVTAFNKAMIDLLQTWIWAAIQRSSSLTGVAQHSRAAGNGGSSGWWNLVLLTPTGHDAQVMLVNRDRLPGRVFGVEHDWCGPWPRTASELLTRAKTSLDPRRLDSMADVLTSAFLGDELERVIYGMEAFTRGRYLEVERRGRGQALRREAREVVFTVLMPDPLPDHFVYRRIRAFRKYEDEVSRGEQLQLATRWTHVFVDECQDFTAADFKLLACVPPGPEHLVVAGDETQSMHLGPSYHRPGIPGKVWKKHELVGSYRLPMRVAEALAPLAGAFIDTHGYSDADEIDLVLLEARKSAVLGPRPIVLAGDSTTFARDLRCVFDLYRSVFSDDDGAIVTVAEGEPRVSRVISDCGAGVVLDTANRMQAIKGLEKRCVVFSDRCDVGEDEASPEWIYTALTRSNALLILVLWDDAPASTKAVLGRLAPDRLLFWNQQAEATFRVCTSLVDSEVDPLSTRS